MANKSRDMTTGSPLKNILLFSIPILIGNIFQQFYNMTDTIIVGRFLGEEALGAVGSTWPLTFLILGFANGIAQGFAILISQSFGAKDFKRLKHFVAVSLMMTFIVSLILTIVTVFFSRQFLILMKTPANILDYTDAYIKVIFAGLVMTMAYNVASSILRSIGDSRTPLCFLIISCFLNIGMDLFFIGTLKLGTAGAALATIISQGISAILCFIYMFRKFDILRVKRSDFYLDANTVFQVLSLGIPMALNNSITAIGTMVLQGAVNTFGSTVVAAYAAASRVENLATQVLITIGSAVTTYCGQNLGAGKYDRIHTGLRKTFWLMSSIAIAGLALFYFAGRPVISWFVANPTEELYTYAMQYLLTSGCFLVPLSWIFLYRNALQGIGVRAVPMIGGIIELICRSTVVFLLLKPLGYWCIRIANPLTWTITGLFLTLNYLHWLHKTKNNSQIKTHTVSYQEVKKHETI